MQAILEWNKHWNYASAATAKCNVQFDRKTIGRKTGIKNFQHHLQSVNIHHHSRYKNSVHALMWSLFMH